MALYGTYLDLSMLSTIHEENNVEFPVSQSSSPLSFIICLHNNYE